MSETPTRCTNTALTAATGEKLSESPSSKTDSTMEESILATAGGTFAEMSAKSLWSIAFN